MKILDLDQLQINQMIERENEVVRRLNVDLGNTAQILKDLKNAAFHALRDAESRMYNYAIALEVGPERERAFEIFENIRLAAMQGK